MFRIITGNLGSGKTYYAVNYLKKFSQYDKLYDVMILDSDVLLVTNVTDIKVPHMTVDEFRQKDLIDTDKLRAYLNDQRFKRVIYIHDECQKIYGNCKDNKEFFFFEFSRHFGIDIFLIVQTVTALPRRLVEIAEYVLDAKPRTLALMGFQYDMKDSKTGNKISSIMIKKDKDVFRLYKSFEIDEREKPKKVVLKKIVVGAVVMILAIFGTHAGLKNAFGVRDEGNKLTGQKATEVKKDENSIKKANQENVKTKKASTENISGVKAKEDQGIYGEGFPIEPLYVLRENHYETQIRPHGRVRGVANTDKGTYYFYDDRKEQPETQPNRKPIGAKKKKPSSTDDQSVLSLE